MIALARTVLDVLFASLWQDALIGLVVALLLWLTRRRLNAATRHAVLHVTLIAMVFTSVATTLSAVGSSVVLGGGSSIPAVIPSAAAEPITGGVLFRVIGIRLGDPAVLSLVLVWLAGVTILLGNVGLGYVRLTRILRRCNLFGTENGVALFECSTISMPFAAGFLRPSIVIPKTLVDEGAAELECAVLHELAHVGRRDAWTHALERVVYAIFFFNPGIVLTLRALKWEREAACDDLAVSKTPNVETYARTLASLAMRGADHGDIVAACGANGFAHPIVGRIERLEDSHLNRSTRLSRYAIAAAVVGLVSIAFSLQSFAPAFAFAPPSAPGRPSVAELTLPSQNAKCNHDVEVVAMPAPKGPLPSGRVMVNVLVLPSGQISRTSVGRSSGSSTLDRVAVSLARKTTYSPAIRNCKRIAAVYQFMLTSDPQR